MKLRIANSECRMAGTLVPVAAEVTRRIGWSRVRSASSRRQLPVGDSAALLSFSLRSSRPFAAKQFCLPSVFTALLFALSAASPALAQNFAVDRFVLTGGGGTSASSSFSLTGTIGQPDAGAKLTGGQYTMDTGFWSAAIAVQTAGAPRLSVVRVGGNVIISWPSADSVGFIVEQSGTPGTLASWSTSGATLTDNGTTKSMTVPATPGYKFFRLRKP